MSPLAPCDHDECGPTGCKRGHGTVDPIVGNPIPPETELSFLAVGLPASAATEGAARWALAEIKRFRERIDAVWEQLTPTEQRRIDAAISRIANKD